MSTSISMSTSDHEPAEMTPEATTESHVAASPIETATERGLSPEDLASVRELVLRANPDVVPELITGASVTELTASIEPARAAYQRIVEAGRREGAGAGNPPVVPAGGATQVIDPDRLPTAEKLRRGVELRSR